MRTASLILFSWIGLLAVATAIVLLGDGRAQSTGQDAAKVELKVIKYDQLTQAIKAQKGKIVVVDIWAWY